MSNVVFVVGFDLLTFPILHLPAVACVRPGIGIWCVFDNKSTKLRASAAHTRHSRIPLQSISMNFNLRLWKTTSSWAERRMPADWMEECGWEFFMRYFIFPFVRKSFARRTEKKSFCVSYHISGDAARRTGKMDFSAFLSSTCRYSLALFSHSFPFFKFKCHIIILEKHLWYEDDSDDDKRWQHFYAFSASLTTHQLIRADFMIQNFHFHSLKCFIVVSLSRASRTHKTFRARVCSFELLNILKQLFKLPKFIYCRSAGSHRRVEWNACDM